MRRVEAGLREPVGIAVPARADKVACVVAREQAAAFEKVEFCERLVAQKGHEPVQAVRIVVHVQQNLLKPAQHNQVGSQPERPPVAALQRHVQYPVEHFVRKAEHRVRLLIVHNNLRGPQPASSP